MGRKKMTVIPPPIITENKITIGFLGEIDMIKVLSLPRGEGGTPEHS
jgi:hypothetical protein